MAEGSLKIKLFTVIPFYNPGQLTWPFPEFISWYPKGEA